MVKTRRIQSSNQDPAENLICRLFNAQEKGRPMSSFLFQFQIFNPAIVLNICGAIWASRGLNRDSSVTTRAVFSGGISRGFFMLQALDGAYQKEYGKSYDGKTHHGVN